MILFPFRLKTEVFRLLVLRDPIPVVCFVIEHYVIYHLFCNLIKKGLRQVLLALGQLEKGNMFNLGKGKKSWQ